MISVDAPATFEPLVSVIIPVFNRAQTIQRAITSVLAQTYPNFEIIVVDDASSDGLADVLNTFTGALSHHIVHPRNRGAAAARNTGVAAACGEFVAFLDSDDAWLPDKLAHQVSAMYGVPPEVAGHVCAYECVKEGDPARRLTPDWSPLAFFRSQLLGCTCGPGTTLLCRRAIFAEIGPFDEELRRLEDWDWLLRLAEQGYRLLGSPEVQAWVEVGAGASRPAVEAAVRRIRERHLAIIAREGAASRRLFEATLHLERAAAAFGDGAYAPAVFEMMRSLARHPLRGGAFYRRMMRRAARAAGRAGERRAAATLSPAGR